MYTPTPPHLSFIVRCEHNADDAYAVIQGLKLEGQPLIGIGHSMGGMAVLMTEMSHPGMFQRIIVIEPTLFIQDITPVLEDEFCKAFVAFAMKKRAHWPSRYVRRWR